MRITNLNKEEILTIIKAYKIPESIFTFKGENEIYKIKYKLDYFEFIIKKEGQDKYYSTFKTVANKNFVGSRGNWEELMPIFNKWIREIKEDIELSQPKLISNKRKFSTLIKQMSSRFIRIYNQALVAEKNGLNEICGLGYRKAFEILLKDYLIKKHDESEHNKIKKLFVSQCINNYVTSDEIKLLSHRVFWLGNDHAHYIKRWHGKSLKDLKDLIDLAVKWIEIHEKLLKIEKEMPNKK